MADRKVIRISSKAEQLVHRYAEAHAVPAGSAADALITVGWVRQQALARYAKQQHKKFVKKVVKKVSKRSKATKRAA